MQWIEALNLASVERYTRTPAVPEFQLNPRVIAPVRGQGLLLGYLCVIDEDESMTARQIESTVRQADEIGTVLYRYRMIEQQDREREWGLVGKLLGSDHQDQRAAVRDLESSGSIVSCERIGVLVCAPVAGAGLTIDEAVGVMLVSACDRLRRQLPPRHALAHFTPRHAELVIAVTGEWQTQMQRTGSLLLECCQKAFAGASAWGALVGIGAPVENLDSAWRAAVQARRAAEFGRRSGLRNRTVRWEQLGLDQWVMAASEVSDAQSLLPEGLGRLLEDSEAPVLIQTLERYLELAGDAAATSAALYVHRTTLYQRLKRVERITGMNLKSGSDRVILALGLRLLRLSGFDLEQSLPSAVSSLGR